VADVQAVCGRIEADVELDLLSAEKVSETFRIRALRKETSLLENVIYVCVLAYIVRNK
jgi:hypothetical protein